MKYDFDRIIPRLNTDSVKWDRTEKLFGDKNILPMWIADMDLGCPKPVTDALKERAEHSIYGYTTRSEGYFAAFVEWMRRRHDWSVEKRWIRCTPGIMPALSMAIRSFTAPGDSIVIQPPVYTPFMEVVEKNDRNLVYNPLKLNGDRYVMDYDNLKEIVVDPRVRMIILCSPHNPVGRVWTPEELEELGRICIDNDVLVVSDEAHIDFVRHGHRHTPFAKLSQKHSDNSITCTAPSKTFNLAGVQMANIIIPNEALRRPFTNTIDSLYLGLSNTFGTTATEAAYRHGEDWFDQCLEYIEDNYRYLEDFVETNLEGVRVIPPEGTYLVWLDFRELELDGRSLENFLRKEAGVAFDEGYTFGPGGDGFTRINIACSRSLVETALRQIQSALHSIPVPVGKGV